MAKRVVRRVAVIVPVIALVPFGLAYACCKIDWYSDGVTRTGDAKSQLITLARAVQLIASEGKFAVEDWEKIHGMSDLAPLITPRMEMGEKNLIDPWGKPFVLERRDRGNDIVLKTHNGRQLPGQWCDFCGRGEIGIEIVVSRTDGQVKQVNRLWK